MLAASVLAFGAVLAAPAPAQQPGSGQNYQFNNPLNYQPGGNQSGGTGGNGQPGQAGQGFLPPPKGYVPRTPPPQAQPQQPQRSASTALPSSGGSGGTVMYFQKPADALTATGGPGSSAGGVAQLNEPAREPLIPVPVPVPDATTPPLPPPPATRYPDRAAAPAPNPALVIPPVESSATAYQPTMPPSIDPYVVEKKQTPIPKVDPKYIRLPPRESIFMAYDDLELERAVIARMIQDRITELQTRIQQDRDALKTEMDPMKIADLRSRIATAEKTLAGLSGIKDPLAEPSYRFPPLPVISPPGLAYRPKTLDYEPRKLIVEPGYVVHRRLHFEEKNAERAGWDMGPFSTLVAATHFCRDAILWPQSLASGCVYGFWDTSAGKCLPGSPSPYYLYPPGLTLTGSIVEAGAIIGTAAVFP